MYFLVSHIKKWINYSQTVISKKNNPFFGVGITMLPYTIVNQAVYDVVVVFVHSSCSYLSVVDEHTACK